MLDYLVYIAVRAAMSLLNALPLALRNSLLTIVVRIVARIVPGFSRVSMRNLEIAFPDQTREWRRQIIGQSYGALARLLVDFARLDSLDEQWVREHVECPFLERFKEIKKAHSGQGVMLATGHLGSFELLAHCVARFGFQISFVVRPFKLKRLNEWWRGKREAAGHRAISRAGAFKEIGRDLAQGRDVAVLFDQNVTRNHAVFVDWFGHKAATTKTVALAALRQKTPIIVTSIQHIGNDRYRIHACEAEVQSLYDDQALSIDAKVEAITAIISKHYEEMIRQNPGEWFWMHKRWKTRPTEAEPGLY